MQKNRLGNFPTRFIIEPFLYSLTNVNYLYKISLLYDRGVLFWDGFY